MKTPYIVLILLGCILLLILAILKFPNPSDSNLKTIKIGDQILKVEMMDTDAKRAQGLSGRKSLPKDQGLLFLFPSKAQYAFWMKDMHFPIDMIWIDGDTVVDITRNVPPPSPGTADYLLPKYQPKVPVDKVLEVVSTQEDAKDISIGDRLIITEQH